MQIWPPKNLLQMAKKWKWSGWLSKEKLQFLPPTTMCTISLKSRKCTRKLCGYYHRLDSIRPSLEHFLTCTLSNVSGIFLLYEMNNSEHFDTILTHGHQRFEKLSYQWILDIHSVLNVAQSSAFIYQDAIFSQVAWCNIVKSADLQIDINVKV